MLLADETFWGLTPTAWAAIGTTVLAVVAGAALVVNVLTTRHIREDVALQVHSLNLGLNIVTWSGAGPVELRKQAGGALLIHHLRLVQVSKTSDGSFKGADVKQGTCQPVEGSLPRWLHSIDRMDFGWPTQVSNFDEDAEVPWFEVEFSLSERGPRHVTRLPGIDGNSGGPQVAWV